jgi:hypothetical protein
VDSDQQVAKKELSLYTGDWHHFFGHASNALLLQRLLSFQVMSPEWTTLVSHNLSNSSSKVISHINPSTDCLLFPGMKLY